MSHNLALHPLIERRLAGYRAAQEAARILAENQRRERIIGRWDFFVNQFLVSIEPIIGDLADICTARYRRNDFLCDQDKKEYPIWLYFPGILPIEARLILGETVLLLFWCNRRNSDRYYTKDFDIALDYIVDRTEGFCGDVSQCRDDGTVLFIECGAIGRMRIADYPLITEPPVTLE